MRSSSVEHAAEFRLVVGCLAEAAEERRDGPEGGQTVPAYVPHHHPDPVLGGDGLVQIAADARAPVGGELRGGDIDPVETRRQRTQDDVLRGPRDPPGEPQLPEQSAPDMEYESGADGEEHGTGDDARPEPVLLGERAAELVADRDGSPDGGQYGSPGGRPCLDADHASGPPYGP